MTDAKVEPRVTFGMIVLNGLPLLEYNLNGLYPFAHQIIVVEGACEPAASLATPDGHSMDGTLEMLRRFKDEDDPESKLILVTAEDDGGPNGFWTEKDEMSQAYARRATGDWLWQVDYDEFYLERDMRSVLDMVMSDPEIAGVSFPFLNFWGGFEYLEDGEYFRYRLPGVPRLFRWRAGYHYAGHRPPTVVDEKSRDLRSLTWVSHRQMRKAGTYMYHYSTVLPKQAEQKAGYYANVTWGGDGFGDLEQWLTESYYGLRDPYHIGEGGRSIPQWLQRYRGGRHPAQIVKLQQHLASGELDEPTRPTDDLDRLLNSPLYALGRWGVRVRLFIFWTAKRLIASFKRLPRGLIVNPLPEKYSLKRPYAVLKRRRQEKAKIR